MFINNYEYNSFKYYKYINELQQQLVKIRI